MKVQNKLKASQKITKCDGVTLLELIVAVAIVGILASIAVPAFDNQIKNSRLKANASLVAGAYSLARSEAINRNLDVGVVNITNGWAVVEVGSGDEINRFEPDGKGITWDPVSLPAITYTPTGFRTFGSSVEVITLEDGRGITRTITISTAGSIKVEK